MKEMEAGKAGRHAESLTNLKHVQPDESCLDNINKSEFRLEGARRYPEPYPCFRYSVPARMP